MEKISILHLEDDPSDSDLILSEISKALPDIEYRRVESREDFENELGNHHFDLILADYNLPSYDGLSALKYAAENYPAIPFILISGTLGEEIAVHSLNLGAADYLLKQNLKRLVPAVMHALDESILKKQKLLTEQELRISEEKYRRIFENTQDAFFQVDLNSTILEISPAIYKLSGYTREELIGRSVLQFYYDPDDRSKFIEDVTASGEVWDYEIRLKAKDGRVLYSSLNAHLMLNSGNVPMGIEGSLRDINERKNFEIQLKKAKEKAEQSDRLKTAFLNNISHEIRTPMNAIIGFSSILGTSSESREEQESFISMIQDSSYQLLSIINDIVDISSIEAGTIKKKITSLNLNAALRNLHSQFNLKTHEREISLNLVTGLADDRSVIETDQTRLKQIISNLLDNAFKFTNKGKIDFGYIYRKEYLEFFVSDTGIGISKEFHRDIFKSFFQIETSLNRISGGTGLGLSICKAYADLLGGRIWLDSMPGKGSTFYFTIPYVPVEQPVSDKPDKIRQKMLNLAYKPTILIVEDDENNILLIQSILKEYNLNILTANNGIDAVEKCKQENNIDVVLMDLKMPFMDGYTATSKIKEILPDLPIIAQTAYHNESEKAISHGFDDFIAKPFDRQQLLTKISEYI
jgi:PAS domain S-box-containing protein